MKTKSMGVMALWAASLGAGSMLVACKEEAAPAPALSASDKAAAGKVAADKAAADKAAEQSAAVDKALAGKAAADKAAAEKSVAQAKAEGASLPSDLVETKAEIARMTAQMDVTMAKLDALSTAKGDLDKPSEGALEAIDTLEGEIKSLKKRGENMRDRGAAYFEAWEKQLAQMSTPEVMAIASKRKDELAAKYAEVLTAMQETRSALDSYWADMKVIHAAVDDDLTPETQKLLGPQVKTAQEKAATLKQRIEDTSSKLNQVSLLYSKP